MTTTNSARAGNVRPPGAGIPRTAALSVRLPPHGPGSGPGAAPRLVRTQVVLDDGHRLGVAVAGSGVPLVVVHGFAAEGVLYAQTLSRLVDMGFKVIAIDSPSHGGTEPLGLLADLDDYVDLLGRAVRALGIKHALLAGHSMGGRLVAELAVAQPELALGVVLINAIAGKVWDRLNAVFRVAPPAYLGLGAVLLADAVATLPVRSDPAHAVKLARLIFPTGAHHVRRPWRLIGPLQAIARARPSRDGLDVLSARGVPVAVLHGVRDPAVSVAGARSVAERTDADLVLVKGAGHSWLLGDPEAFPAILAELLDGGMGNAIRAALAGYGVDADATPGQVEAVLLDDDALVVELTPPGGGGRRAERPPRFSWDRARTAGT